MPTVVAAIAAVVAAVGAFLPWYAPDIAPPLAAESVSGWNATFAAKLLVVGAVMAGLAASVLLVDSAQRMALDRSGVRALSAVCAVGMAVAATAAVWRTVDVPEPADLLSRQIGVYVSVAAAVVGVIAALVQLLFTFGSDDGARPNSQGRGRRRR